MACYQVVSITVQYRGANDVHVRLGILLRRLILSRTRRRDAPRRTMISLSWLIMRSSEQQLAARRRPTAAAARDRGWRERGRDESCKEVGRADRRHQNQRRRHLHSPAKKKIFQSEHAWFGRGARCWWLLPPESCGPPVPFEAKYFARPRRSER